MLNQQVAVVMDLFREMFECDGREFGNPVYGLSDGVEGVQWNASHDGTTAWLGVNLEGMKYDGWPVARLIERELSRPLLLRCRDKVPRPETVTMNWRRDAWQIQHRPPIKEGRIASITLDQLGAEEWRQALLRARNCLDPKRGYRGRCRMRVTLTRSGEPRIMEVTPHLWFGNPFDENHPHSMQRAKDNLQALYDFAQHQARR